MSEHKDWALITNYADRSLIRNKLTYKLARDLGFPYSPDSRDVELYINGSYEGVYLLAETIKASKNRVNIDEQSFLVEVDYKHHEKDVIVYNEEKRPFNIKHPKQPSKKQIEAFQKNINAFEKYLLQEFSKDSTLGNLSQWIDIEDYLRFYWIQEVSKNPDLFLSSTFFTWSPKEPIRMGPVWDFDAAYGIYPKGTTPMEWSSRKRGWNKMLFQNRDFRIAAKEYWIRNRKIFDGMLDSIDVFSQQLSPAAENNYRRWPILQDTENKFHLKKYNNYLDAANALKRWYKQRIEWIDKAIDKK